MYRVIMLLIVIISISVGVYIKITSLEKEIQDLKHRLELTTKSNGELTSQIIACESNRDLIKIKLEEQNKLLEKYKNDIKEKSKKLKEWMNKPPKIKYKVVYKYIDKKVDYNKATCKEGIELNKAISNINYDDL